MNIAWHIVKKDLRRFWLAIALLVVVLAAKAEFLAIASDVRTASILQDDARFLHRPVAFNGRSALDLIIDLNLDNNLANHALAILMGIACVSDFVLLAALVLGILLEDRALGDRTFWRVRPISSGQMLAAKSVAIFLIGWPLQSVMQIILNLTLGLPGAHWYSALGTMTLIQAGFVSLFALTVLLWRNPATGAIILYSLGFGALLSTEYIPSGWIPAGGMDAKSAVVVWIVMTAYIAWWNYGKRRQVFGFVIFGLGLAATVTALLY